MIKRCKVLWQDREKFCIEAIDRESGQMFRHIDYKMNIQSLETHQCLSWYERDVFKKFRYVLIDTETKRFILPDRELYNMRKLKALKGIEDFAFFNYSEYSRLTGIVTRGGFSGLFK